MLCIEVTYADGSVRRYRAGKLPAGKTAAEQEAHYLSLSKRGVAFPGATAFKLIEGPDPQPPPNPPEEPRP